jgi:allantoin racemase
MRLLLVNPNTTEGVTRLCAEEARCVAAPGTDIVPLTAAFGAKIITSRAENAVAAHALLDLLAQHAGEADAVLLAVSYDTGLLAAREMLPVPVVGMTEAAMLAALLVGTRFGLVTFGTPGQYRDLVAERGLLARLANIRTVQAGAVDAYADPARVQDLVLQAAGTLVAEDGADAVVLCGAAMAGMAARLQPRAPVPLLDGIAAGVPLCEMLVRLALPAPTAGSLVAPHERETSGLSPALAALLARRP